MIIHIIFYVSYASSFVYIRYEAGALAPFAPASLEYSFNGRGVEYAGRRLGGRSDRVDVDAGGRAMVID